MDVRAATGGDVAAVTELWVALAREQRDHGSHLFAEENRERARDLIAQYVHADGCAVADVDGVGDVDGSTVGDVDGATVGFVMFHVESGFFETDADRGVVDNVYVLPDARGGGVGSALLEFAESRLRDRGADVFAVEALWDNEAARRLYERRGYAPHRVTMERPAEPGEDGSSSDEQSTEPEGDSATPEGDSATPEDRSTTSGTDVDDT